MGFDICGAIAMGDGSNSAMGGGVMALGMGDGGGNEV
jgi:hypothetical protein